MRGLKAYIWLLFFCLLQVLQLQAQEFRINQYRAADGLQTDMIKAVQQDSLGFVWIASDDGLIKYDGTTFTSFPKSTPSIYIKSFLRTLDGRLLAVHDLGITEIQSSLDSVQFSSFMNGSSVLNDSSLWYPKTAFEDSLGYIWIAEPQSVVKVDPETMNWQRYHFSIADNTTSFVRSFNFLDLSEDELLISSFPGNFFVYRYSEDEIRPVRLSRKISEVHALKKVHGNIIIGTTSGLYKLNHKQSQLEAEEILPGVLITDVLGLDDHFYLATSENTESYLISVWGDNHEAQIIPQTQLNTNQAYLSNDGTIWLSTQKGVALLSRPNFRTVPLDVRSMYVEALATHPSSNEIYLLGKEAIWSIDKTFETSRRIFEKPGGYFLSGSASKDGLWVSNAFEVLYLEQGNVKRRFDLQEYGRFIFTVFLDENGKIWLGQEATNGVKRLDPTTGNIETFDEESGLPSQVSTITEKDGFLYFASPSQSSYLYRSPNTEINFENISHSMPASAYGMIIESMQVLDDNSIWLSTNLGLFHHSENSLSKVPLNTDLDNALVRTLVSDPPYLWFGNQAGLYRYDTRNGEMNLFNESSGLLANAVNQEGLLLSNKKLWVGTAFGLSVMDYKNRVYEKTITPNVFGMKVNGVEVSNFRETPDVSFEPYMEFEFASLSFPPDELRYSYRVPEVDSTWSVPSFEKQATITGLGQGAYTFELRAKKVGEFQWSEVAQLPFIVNNSFYRSWQFYLLLILLVAVFSYLSRKATQYVMHQRQRLLEKMVEERTIELEEHKAHLEELVNERTQELKSRNDELSDANGQLSEAMNNLKETQAQLIQSDKMASLGVFTAGVAHEINNPLNFISGGCQGLEEELKELGIKDQSRINVFMDSVKEGISRVSEIVRGLSQFSRQTAFLDEKCDINAILENCLVILKNDIKERIKVLKSYDKAVIIKGNSGKLHQACLNLLVNASQAIDKNGTIEIKTSINRHHAIIEIADNGVGIPSEVLPKITDPFFTTKDPGKGTGLGLAITYSIVEEHGGELSFSSEPGVGTQATLTFPVHQAYRHEPQ